MPQITVARRPDVWVEFGKYWALDNRWGQGALTEGTALHQFEQAIGVFHDGIQSAFRAKWRWPNPTGSAEVKGYPAAIYGRQPGCASTGDRPGGMLVQTARGDPILKAPSGETPGTRLPLQLPLTAPFLVSARYKHNAPPSGLGHLSIDAWLQSTPDQGYGFVRSSITHEFMIPFTNWGNYGGYPNGRNPNWYDHDAWIDGKLYHVYCSKGSDGRLLPNFGSLDGTHGGRRGWKFIVFQPDVFNPDFTAINLQSFIRYAMGRKDSAGTPWVAGNEYLTSAQLGIETVAGSGDMTMYDLKIHP